MTNEGNWLSLTGVRLAPDGYEWLVVAVFLASVALVLYVATRNRQ